MNKLISIDDADLDQVSGGGPIATAAGEVAGTVIGAAGRLEDGLNNVLGGIFGRVGRVAGAAVAGVQGVIGAAIGR